MKEPHRRRLAVAAWAAAALAAGALACAHSGSRYQDQAMDFGAIRNVAVMPFQNLSRDTLGGDRVREVFAAKLLATGAFYVVPQGEVLRVVSKAGVALPAAPSVEEVVKLGKQLQADAIITGVVKEYGEIRSGANAANVVSVTVHMFEVETGKVVWSASSTKGGITFWMRLFGGGGSPLNGVTEEAVDELLDQLF